MSRLFAADSFAYPDTLDAVRFLSQRDLESDIPINFVPVAGTSVGAACVRNDTYKTGPIFECVSNLLVTGFKRFVLDLYWDDSRNRWNLCPIRLGTSGSSQLSSGSSTSAPNTSASTVISSATLADRDILSNDIRARQATSNPSPASTTSSTSSATTSRVITSAVLVAPTSSTHATSPTSTQSEPVLALGAYVCTASLDFDLFMNLLAAYLDTTENNLNATTIYLTINIHAAGTVSGSTMTLARPTSLPQGNQILSTIINANVAPYLYTPAELIQERANVNATGSWYEDTTQYPPDAAYITLEQAGSITISHDGWPSARFMQYDDGKRILIAFGTVDQEMLDYNMSADSSKVFTSGYIGHDRTYGTTTAGEVNSGCLYVPSTTGLASVNNSWAVANVSQSTAGSEAQDFRGLTSCGIAPVLVSNISNTTADQSTASFQQLIMSTVWSWAAGEPADSTTSGQSFHCAALNATSGYWQVESCSNRHYCACRANSQPYDWLISNSALSYANVDQACPAGSEFSVSRTALENQYLLQAWQQQRDASSTNDELLLLNFNDLDLANCWVMGQTTTCPYTNNDNGTHRLVVVPTVAAVIVFVLAILTVFVKCAANRQNTRQRRRRGNDKMGDYEGVPA